MTNADGWLHVAHTVLHFITFSSTAWLWKERRTLKEVLEDGLERRKNMINPVTLVQDINLAVAAIEKLKSDVPAIQKLVADIRQTVADKNDTSKLDTDLGILLGDVTAQLALLGTLFPSGAPQA